LKSILDQGLPGHKYFSGAKDILFEWKEPDAIRKVRFAAQIRLNLLVLPILFPIFAGIGFLLFAVKVWSNGHSLKEIPLTGLLLVSLMLATLFTLFAFVNVFLQRFAPTIVRLAAKGIGKWKSGWGREFSCEYDQIRTVTVAKHELVPEVSALLVILNSGDQVYLAVPKDDITRAVEILREKGVHCDPRAAVVDK